MQLIRISGPTAPMRRLGEVDGLDVERTSARRLDDERWQVSGYATDAALAELAELGLTVEIVVEPEQLARQRELLFSSLRVARADAPDAPDEPDDPADAP